MDIHTLGLKTRLKLINMEKDLSSGEEWIGVRDRIITKHLICRKMLKKKINEK